MKILLIRFSSIGDIVLTTPVIRCLYQQLDAEIHFLCKTPFASLLSANPYLQQIHSIQKNVHEVRPQLQQLGFDHIIDLHHNLRSWQIKRALGVPQTSLNKLNIKKWLMVNFKLNHLPDRHIVDRYFDTVLHLGVKNDGKGLDFFIPEDSDVKNQESGKKSTGYIAFAIGAAHATKRLPNERIIAICRGLKYPVILLGGPGDAENGKAIALAAGTHVQNRCGQLTVHQSAEMIRDSRLVISHDTGMMHIATAFQKHIVSIWGNTVPAFGMYPYYGNHVKRNQIVEVSNLACRPCSKIGYSKCPKGHFRCMNDIDTQRVIELVEDIWESPVEEP